MEQLFEFLVKASGGIILFYILYWALLRKETYYKLNRYFLLTALVLSFLLPIFPFRYTVLIEANQNAGLFEALNNSFNTAGSLAGEKAANHFSVGWLEALTIIYLTGAFIFFLRIFIQTAILLGLMIKYKLKSIQGIRIVENEKYGIPFSFFNIVFINPKFHTQDDLPVILAHEKVHIRENHWVDLILIELLTVIFWFNPFIWFFERSIKQNHEYLADSAVVSEGRQVAKYQALLVNQLMGMQIIGITNNLNFALNTNRLKMMTKQKTPKIRTTKLAWALPAIVLLLVAFAEPKYEVQPLNEKTGLSEAVTIPVKEKVTIKGKVISKNDGIPMPGATVLIKGTINGTVTDMDGNFTLDNPDPEMQGNESGVGTDLVISFVGYQTINSKVGSTKKDGEGRYTFKLEEGVIKLDLQKMLKEIPPPPPPPKEEKIIKKASKELPPPPPPPAKGEKEFFIVESMPVYPGGQAALAKFILKNAQKYAKVKNVEGKAVIGFTINAKGKVDNINVVKKDNDQAAKAAYAIISQLEDWKPGSQRGKPVPVNYMVPIEF